MNAEAQEMIARLGLAPLPHEGGFFRQTRISRGRLADGRAAGSAILFLQARLLQPLRDNPDDKLR